MANCPLCNAPGLIFGATYCSSCDQELVGHWARVQAPPPVAAPSFNDPFAADLAGEVPTLSAASAPPLPPVPQVPELIDLELMEPPSAPPVLVPVAPPTPV